MTGRTVALNMPPLTHGQQNHLNVGNNMHRSQSTELHIFTCTPPSAVECNASLMQRLMHTDLRRQSKPIAGLYQASLLGRLLREVALHWPARTLPAQTWQAVLPLAALNLAAGPCATLPQKA